MNEELKVLSDEECNFYWGDTIKVYITSWYVDNSTNELKLNLVLKDNSLKMEQFTTASHERTPKIWQK